ncbi:hypothetical protein AB837_00100 [bacterium AB1]|nr:hypothetical protein AB837_00100 [bacterium AB1]
MKQNTSLVSVYKKKFNNFIIKSLSNEAPSLDCIKALCLFFDNLLYKKNKLCLINLDNPFKQSFFKKFFLLFLNEISTNSYSYIQKWQDLLNNKNDIDNLQYIDDEVVLSLLEKIKYNTYFNKNANELKKKYCDSFFSRFKDFILSLYRNFDQNISEEQVKENIYYILFRKRNTNYISEIISSKEFFNIDVFSNICGFIYNGVCVFKKEDTYKEKETIVVVGGNSTISEKHILDCLNFHNKFSKKDDIHSVRLIKIQNFDLFHEVDILSHNIKNEIKRLKRICTLSNLSLDGILLLIVMIVVLGQNNYISYNKSIFLSKELIKKLFFLSDENNMHKNFFTTLCENNEIIITPIFESVFYTPKFDDLIGIKFFKYK